MKRMILVLVILLMTTAMVFAGGGQSSTSTGGPTRISVEVFDRGSDGGRSQANNNAWTNWIQQKVLKDLNIEVTFVPVGRWSEDTDIVNLMASNSAPDLCYTYNEAMITQFSQMGGILDLAPYIDSLLPDFKKLLGEDTAIPGQDFIYRNRETATGRIYSVRSVVVNAGGQRNVFIRKDWLDRLGLAVPRTAQEFYNALVAFRDRDPGNVGRNRVVPYGQDSDARWGLASIINTYINASSERELWINRFGDTPVSAPGYKEGVRLMNRWYNEGLIYHDFPLMRVADDYHNMLKSGVVGAFSGNMDIVYRTDYNINVELAQNVPGAEFVPVDYPGTKDASDKAGLYIFVPSSSRNPEAALRYLNWLSINENYNFLQIGNVGVNHEIVNGVPRVLSTPAGHAWFQNSQYNIDYTLPLNGIQLGNTELNSRVVAQAYGNIPADTIINAITIANRNSRAQPVNPGVVVTTLGTYGQTLRDKGDALLAQSITASVANFDRVWDAGYQDWLSSGGQAVLDERATLWPANRR